MSDATARQYTLILKIDEAIEIAKIKVGVIATDHSGIDIIAMRPAQRRNQTRDRAEDCQRIAMSNH